MPANLEYSELAIGLEKVSFHSSPNEGQCQRMFKLLDSFHMQVKSCSKSFKLDFSSMWTENFQIYKLGLEKAEKPEIKLPAFIGSQRKQQNPRKTPTSASLTPAMPLTVWITTNWKILNRWEYQTTLPISWETCMQVKKQQLEPYMEQWTGSKLGNVPQVQALSTTRLYIVTLFI